MTGIKPLFATMFLWTAAQIMGASAQPPLEYRAADFVYAIISGTVLLALIGAAVKYGKLLNKVDTLSLEVTRLRERLEK
jgi:hypothetical protein